MCRASLVPHGHSCSEHPIRSADTTVFTETSLNLDPQRPAALQHEIAIRSPCCGTNEVFSIHLIRDLWKVVCEDALTHSLCAKQAHSE